MPGTGIDRLIINSPYLEPSEYWRYHRETRTFTREKGRRPAGYVTATPGSRSFDDPGIFIELPLVNQIRPRVKAWREAGYPGVTGITKRLLGHWQDPEERQDRRFFFCQLEAMETLIWLTEAPDADKVGIEIPGDGGPFQRLCTKMATGSGKTIVMAMLIAWQVLNKVTYPQDTRFAKNVLMVAPGLTVKSRLQVLMLSADGNYYDEFNIVPMGLLDKLRQGKILVSNWHVLNWETEEHIARKKSVDKRGAKSNEAYVRDVLGDMANARNILVINDEAHHAWRIPAESKIRGVAKEDIEEATKWIGGLDRIDSARGILNCYDFTATPFTPSGKASSEEALFDWIVSDFGLNDAIESGLVKTPRVVVRDDAIPSARDYRSRLYHIYADREVSGDLNRRAQEMEPLPDLVVNGYYLLGADWREAASKWKNEGALVPPVMITVANRTETAARIRYAFDHKRIDVEGLTDSDRTLHIDSKVLKQAESQEEPVSLEVTDEDEDDEADAKPKLTRQQQAELLRQIVDTVGQIGQRGEQIQHIISVGMLSEGWDAKTVTHIMGLRAFSSQLLCEQVVGRGLRRTTYEVNEETGFFEPEYVNIFGVPFTFLPHEGGDGPPPPPPTHKTRIEPDNSKRQFALCWPNIVRIEHPLQQRLTLDLHNVRPLELDASQTATQAELAAILEGKPNLTQLSQIDLERLAGQYRLQRLIFTAAANLFDQMRPDWKGNREFLIAQSVKLVQQFLRSDLIIINPPLFNQDELRRRIVLAVNINKVVQYMWVAIRVENAESLEPVFDDDHPIRSTEDMRTWWTSKPCHPGTRTHINFCVYDSSGKLPRTMPLNITQP
jgi:type III restriction enzyme